MKTAAIGYAFDEIKRDRSGKMIAHPAAVASNLALERRLARDQAEPENGTSALSAETALECIRVLIKRTSDDERSDLLASLREMIDRGVEASAQDQPPPFPGMPQTGGSMVPMDRRPRMAGDRAFRAAAPTSAARQSFAEMFPEIARIQRL